MQKNEEDYEEKTDDESEYKEKFEQTMRQTESDRRKYAHPDFNEESLDYCNANIEKTVNSNSGILGIIAHSKETVNSLNIRLLNTNIRESINSVIIQFVEFSDVNTHTLCDTRSRYIELRKIIQLFEDSGSDIVKTMARLDSLGFSELGKEIIQGKKTANLEVNRILKNPDAAELYTTLTKKRENSLITIEHLPYSFFKFEAYRIEEQPKGSDFSALALFSSKNEVHNRIINEMQMPDGSPIKFLNLIQFDHICKLGKSVSDILKCILAINNSSYLQQYGIIEVGKDDYNFQHEIRIIHKVLGRINISLVLRELEISPERELELSQQLLISTIDSYSLQLFMHFLGYNSMTYVNRACRSSDILSLHDLRDFDMVEKNKLKICSIRLHGRYRDTRYTGSYTAGNKKRKINKKKSVKRKIKNKKKSVKKRKRINK